MWILKKAESLNIDISKYPCFVELRTECLRIIDQVYISVTEVFDIHSYYHSWMLRGDNPERYTRDGAIKEKIEITKYEYFDLNKNVDDEYRTQKAIKLFHAYHYNPDVKKRGVEIYDFKVTSDYKRIIKEIQKKMRFEIAKKGIFIECNPTSNYLIAKLRRYEKHPIITFYNDELYNGLDNDCAQINVSINTDDQGVFDTSLENEYALMAYALENVRDKEGLKYTSNQVYKWIDSVRRMGIQQKFK